jgi:hypothetical protein
MSREDAQGTPRQLSHGQLCYWQIPARDVAQSARFYAAVFGWKADPPGSDFTAPGMIGQWITDREPTPDAGAVGWLHVDDIEATLALATANGGQVLMTPEPDGEYRILAEVRDPAGNTMGVVAHRR